MKLCKVILSALCTLGLLAACSSQHTASPTTVATAFLDAYQAHDNEAIKETSNWTNFDAKSLELSKQDYVKGVDEALQQEVYQKMMDVSYQENAEEIKEEIAVVSVTLRVYDFAPAIKQGMEEATKKAEELSQQSEISDEEIQSAILTVLFENMNKAEQNKTIDVRIKLVKQNKAWIVDQDNDELRNALLQNSQAVEQLA